MTLTSLVVLPALVLIAEHDAALALGVALLRVVGHGRQSGLRTGKGVSAEGLPRLRVLRLWVGTRIEWLHVDANG